MVLPEGKTAPRLGGSQKPLSRGFLSNLRDFLMERPVKVAKNVPGDVFTVDEYGDSLTENFREWFKPTPKAVSSRMTVAWQSPYKVMWQNLRDLVSPPKLPPLKVTSQPVRVKDIWSKDKAFGPSQAIALAFHIGITALIFSPLLYEAAKKVAASPVNNSLITPIDISDYTAKLPPARTRPAAAVEAAREIRFRLLRVGPRSSVSTRLRPRWCTPSPIRRFRRPCLDRRT